MVTNPLARAVPKYPFGKNAKRFLLYDYRYLGKRYWQAWQLSEAESALRKVIPVGEQVARETPDVMLKKELSICFNVLGNVYLERGQWEQARDVFARCRKLKWEIMNGNSNWDWQIALAVACCNLAWANDRLGRSKEAEAFFEQALDVATRTAQAHSQTVEVKQALAQILSRRAWTLVRRPTPQAAEVARALQWAKQAAGLPATDNMLQQALGVALLRAGEPKAALAHLLKLEVTGEPSCGKQEMYGREAPGPSPGIIGFSLAMASSQLGDQASARAWYDKAVSWMKQYQVNDKDLRSFHAEAAALLGLDPLQNGVKQKPGVVVEPPKDQNAAPRRGDQPSPNDPPAAREER
jgi:tetratricopeptide (TPR) repeat protein